MNSRRSEVHLLRSFHRYVPDGTLAGCSVCVIVPFAAAPRFRCIRCSSGYATTLTSNLCSVDTPHQGEGGACATLRCTCLALTRCSRSVSVARLAEAYFDTHRQQVAATPSQLANIVMVALVFFVQLHNHAVGCSQPLTLTKTGPGEAVLHMGPPR